MIRPFLIDLNPVEPKYCPFVISLDKYRGCVPSKTKDINVKVFNTITNANFKCKFNSATCISNQKWKNETCQ